MTRLFLIGASMVFIGIIIMELTDVFYTTWSDRIDAKQSALDKRHDEINDRIAYIGDRLEYGPVGGSALNQLGVDDFNLKVDEFRVSQEVYDFVGVSKVYRSFMWILFTVFIVGMTLISLSVSHINTFIK